MPRSSHDLSPTCGDLPPVHGHMMLAVLTSMSEIPAAATPHAQFYCMLRQADDHTREPRCRGP